MLGASDAAEAEGWVFAGWVGAAALPAGMLGEVLSAGVPVAFVFVISRPLKTVLAGMLEQPDGLEAAHAERWAP